MDRAVGDLDVRREVERGLRGDDVVLQGARDGHRLERRAVPGVGPAAKQPGAEGAVVAAPGHGQEIERPELARMSGGGLGPLLALPGRKDVPDERLQIDRHEVAGTGDAGDAGPGRELGGDGRQAWGMPQLINTQDAQDGKDDEHDPPADDFPAHTPPRRMNGNAPRTGRLRSSARRWPLPRRS